MNTEKYDLLFGGSYSIKEYYMESGNPRQMRGASELLSECAKDVEKILLSRGVKPEYIIASGGTLSAKVPRGMGTEIATEAECVFREKCRTANAAFVAVPFDDSYRKVKERALAEYESRKSAKFISWEFQNAVIENGNLSYLQLTTKQQSEKYRCPRCRLRTPRYYVEHNNGEEQYLCTSCAIREEKSGDRKYIMRLEGRERFDDNCEIEIISDSVSLEPSSLQDVICYGINTTADLANDGRIALLYADINNLGGHKLEPFEFDIDKAFHDAVGETVKKAVDAAIGRAMDCQKGDQENQFKFEIIALGGDDVCLLLPGDVALIAAKTLVDNFDKNKSDPELTISVAVCVAKDTTALTYMERIVEEALLRTKEYARKNGQSAICLSLFEKPSNLFPMTAKEMNQFSGLLCEVSSVSTTALRNIAEARRELEPDSEFVLYLNYYLSRDVTEIKNSRPILEKIRKDYEGKNPWPDFVAWRHQKLNKGVVSDA